MVERLGFATRCGDLPDKNNRMAENITGLDTVQNVTSPVNAQSLTFGQKAVGLTFNPSNDPTVQKLKELYAQIIDVCNETRGQDRNEKARLFSVAITEAQGAQMWAVKAATWKF